MVSESDGVPEETPAPDENGNHEETSENDGADDFDHIDEDEDDGGIALLMFKKF